jgi:hypothetical protein
VIELDRSRALDLLHELCDSIKESSSKSSVSANNAHVAHIFTGGYQLKMKVNLDEHSRAIINELMKRNKLYMKEENDLVTLRSIGD